MYRWHLIFMILIPRYDTFSDWKKHTFGPRFGYDFEWFVTKHASTPLNCYFWHVWLKKYQYHIKKKVKGIQPYSQATWSEGYRTKDFSLKWSFTHQCLILGRCGFVRRIGKERVNVIGQGRIGWCVVTCSFGNSQLKVGQ